MDSGGLRIGGNARWLVAVLTAAACAVIHPPLSPGGAAAEAAAPAGAADSAATFFHGKIITFIVPDAVGGGFDRDARLIAPYLARYTGANVEVLNQPGAGGLIGDNNIFTAAPDGLTIGIVDAEGAVAAEAAGAAGVRYHMAQFSWLGRLHTAPQTIIVGAKGPLHSFADLVALGRQRPVCFTANGLGSAGYLAEEVFKTATDLNANIVTGFKGSGEKMLALVQRSCDADSDSDTSVYSHVRSGQVVPILVMDDTPSLVFPKTELASGIPASDAGKQLLGGYFTLVHMGRLIGGPPGIAADRLAFLRRAFAQTVRDPDLLARSHKLHEPLDHVPGDQVPALVAAALAVPAAMKQLLVASYGKH